MDNHRLKTFSGTLDHKYNTNTLLTHQLRLTSSKSHHIDKNTLLFRNSLVDHNTQQHNNSNDHINTHDLINLQSPLLIQKKFNHKNLDKLICLVNYSISSADQIVKQTAKTLQSSVSMKLFAQNKKQLLKFINKLSLEDFLHSNILTYELKNQILLLKNKSNLFELQNNKLKSQKSILADQIKEMKLLIDKPKKKQRAQGSMKLVNLLRQIAPFPIIDKYLQNFAEQIKLSVLESGGGPLLRLETESLVLEKQIIEKMSVAKELDSCIQKYILPFVIPLDSSQNKSRSIDSIHVLDAFVKKYNQLSSKQHQIIGLKEKIEFCKLQCLKIREDQFSLISYIKRLFTPLQIEYQEQSSVKENLGVLEQKLTQTMILFKYNNSSPSTTRMEEISLNILKNSIHDDYKTKAKLSTVPEEAGSIVQSVVRSTSQSRDWEGAELNPYETKKELERVRTEHKMMVEKIEESKQAFQMLNMKNQILNLQKLKWMKERDKLTLQNKAFVEERMQNQKKIVELKNTVEKQKQEQLKLQQLEQLQSKLKNSFEFIKKLSGNDVDINKTEQKQLREQQVNQRIFQGKNINDIGQEPNRKDLKSEQSHMNETEPIKIIQQFRIQRNQQQSKFHQQQNMIQSFVGEYVSSEATDLLQMNQQYGGNLVFSSSVQQNPYVINGLRKQQDKSGYAEQKEQNEGNMEESLVLQFSSNDPQFHTLNDFQFRSQVQKQVHLEEKQQAQKGD